MSKYALKFKGARSKSRTQQNFRDDVNVNTIMRKARRTGVLPVKQPVENYFQDLIGYEDYHTSLNKIMAIDKLFAQLPAKCRNKFKNDPAEILTFLQDPKNKAEAQEIGLIRANTHQENIDDGIIKVDADGKIITEVIPEKTPEEKPEETT